MDATHCTCLVHGTALDAAQGGTYLVHGTALLYYAGGRCTGGRRDGGTADREDTSAGGTATDPGGGEE